MENTLNDLDLAMNLLKEELLLDLCELVPPPDDPNHEILDNSN